MKYTGNDLVKLGFKPAKWFKEALTYINANELSNDTLLSYLNSMVPKELETIKPFSYSIPYYSNIVAETKEEKGKAYLIENNL